MKRILIFASILAAALLGISCEEDFNPKAPLKDTYILFSVIRSSYTLGAPTKLMQRVVISRSYDVNGYNPNLNSNDPSIAGAKVVLIKNNIEYPMKDTTIINSDPGHIPQSYYFCILAPGNNERVKIAATLPDGRTLSAETRIPIYPNPGFSYNFPHGITNKIYKILWDIGYINIDWGKQVRERHVYFPRLSVNYVKKEIVNGKIIYKSYSKPMPLDYIKKDNGYIPVYSPQFTTDESLSFRFACFDSVLTHLSDGDANKENYYVDNLTFQLMEYDDALSKYYSSTSGLSDKYSIRLDETYYSNISGGIGIFGSMATLSNYMQFDKSYLQSFGYLSVQDIIYPPGY
ncbi:MAG: DUF4249 family protein [Ignavibacteriales bacterium]